MATGVKIIQALDLYNKKSATAQPLMIDWIVDLVNEAYWVGEAGMWVDPYQKRTEYEEINKLIILDRLILLVSDDGDEDILGSIMCQINGDTGSLGMLSVDQS